jgi:hypothetical protein
MGDGMGRGGLSPCPRYLDHGPGGLSGEEHPDREVMGDPGRLDGGEEGIGRIQVDGCNNEIIDSGGRFFRWDPLLAAVNIDRVHMVAGAREGIREVRSAMDGIEDEDLHEMVRGAP